MRIQQFLSLRLTGDRFAEHSIPLDFLKELPVLNEMIVEAAKLKFLEDHPDRQRSPRGFTEGFELKLTTIKEGSAVLEIGLGTTTNTLFPTENQTYLENALDVVVNTIAAAEHNEAITGLVPERMLSYFDRLGRGLRDGEAIEFTTASRRTPAKLTKETRQRLVLRSPEIKEPTQETSTLGTVPEADQDTMTFEIQLLNGQKMKAPIAPQHFGTVMEAFKGYQEGMRFRFEGIGRFSRNWQHLGFDSIEHISALDPLDVSTRLDELRQLKNGWLEGEGLALSGHGLDWLSSTFDNLYDGELPLPYLYPTEEGGIHAEWSLRGRDINLKIDLSTHKAEWLWFEGDAEDAQEVNLDDTETWRWIADEIRQATQGSK